jgi:predicted acylesterase/phospholipase RssA
VLAARAGTDGRPYGDGLRVALAIEGGGMRGVISAGMALELHERGLVPAFDAVYGASAGAITGAWLLSSRPEGLLGWTETAYAKTLIRRSGLLRGRPAVDVRSLIEELYQTTFPMDFASVLASPVEYHPLATDVVTGSSTDLHPFVGNPAELRLALRASAAMPLLAGPPVEFAGRRFYDAGVSESIPYRTALAQGATHILVLRSRRPPAAVDAVVDAVVEAAEAASVAPTTGSPAPRPPRSIRLLTRTTLRNESLALRAALLTRSLRTAADVARILELEVAGKALMIFPPASVPPVSRLTTDGPLLAAALESGRAAMHAVCDWQQGPDAEFPMNFPGSN